MRNHAEGQNAEMECRGHGTFRFLMAGIGIGAAVSVFLAPKSGTETRKWIETKCLDGVEAANARVHKARVRLHEMVDEGQAKVTAAVIARREMIGKAPREPKEVEEVVV